MPIPYSALHKQNLLRNYLAAGYNVHLRLITLDAQLVNPGATTEFLIENLIPALRELKTAYSGMPKNAEDIAFVQAALADYGYTGDVVADAQAVEALIDDLTATIITNSTTLWPTNPIAADGTIPWPTLSTAQRNGLRTKIAPLLTATAG